MLINQRKLELRQSYNQFIHGLGPYEYAVTLTFRRAQSEEDCNQQVNFLLRLLNRKLYGRNNCEKHIEGFACAELHKHFRSTVHYHFILKGDPAFRQINKKSIEEHFYDCLKTVRCSRSNTPAFDERWCKFDRIYKENGWINYLTKSFERSDDTSFIQQLSADGIDRVLW